MCSTNRGRIMKVAGPGARRVEIGRILVLIDPSAPSQSALRVADAVAERFGAGIVAGSARRAQDEAVLKRLAAGSIGHGRLEGVRTVAPAPGRDRIAQLVEETGADAVFLCIGAERRRGLQFPAGVAERVVRAAGLPVFLTRGTPIPAADQPIHVMVAADLVEDASVSARRVAHLFGPQDELHLVHVIRSYVYYPRTLEAVAALTPAETTDRRRRAAWELASVTLGANAPEIGVHVLGGEPAEMLVRAVSDLAADLVVVRTCAGLTYDPAELGPVCGHLVRACPSTLLVLPRVDPCTAA